MVDDEESIRASAHALLDAGGYRALVVSGGAEGAEILRARAAEIAAVLLDATMPGMDGPTAMAQMRPADPEVPAIIASGYRQEGVTARFAGQRVDGFLAKPFRMAQLLETVGQFVER